MQTTMNEANDITHAPLPESYAGAVISTCHVDDTDAELLKQIASKSEYVFNRENGWLLIIPTDHSITTTIYSEDLGPTVYGLAVWAMCRGIRYLELDADGPVLPFLTQYDW
jgi:hypothetical protein